MQKTLLRGMDYVWWSSTLDLAICNRALDYYYYLKNAPLRFIDVPVNLTLG